MTRVETMAKYRVIYWMHIPTMVIATDAAAGQEVRVQLPPRFQTAVDAYAMAAGLTDDEAYSAQWRKGEWQSRDGTAEVVAQAVAAELEAAFPAITLPKSGEAARDYSD